MRRLAYAFVLLLLGVGSASAQRVSPPEYAIRDLGSLDHMGQTEALAINDRGEVVGQGTAANDLTTPFYWSERTGFIKIFNDVDGIALDINNKGQVVGWRNEMGGIRGFLWSRRGGLVSLGSFFPAGINDRGDIVGQCDSNLITACVISKGVISTLAMRPGAAVEASGINEHGEVSATLFDPVVAAAAAVWRRKTYTKTFTVLEPTASDGYNVVLGHDINNRGSVSGTLEDQSGTIRSPVVWDRNGIANINTSVSGFANSLNDHGVVTVQSDVPLAALAWDSRRGTVSVLPSLGGPDRPSVFDINNRGMIVGMSNNGSENRAVMWVRTRR